MNPPDTKANFFRQSGWMMMANTLCGAFMAGAAIFAIRGLTPLTDYPVFATVLRVFVITSIPAAAMQILLAQQVAAAVTEQARRDASATARGVLKVILGLWIILLVAGLLNRDRVMTWLQASDPQLFWGTMFLILGSLLWPLFLGCLQGQQSFFAYGWSAILNGLGRFAMIFIGVKAFQIGATGATYAAMAGFLVAIAIAVWPARHVFLVEPGNFDARAFLKKLAILSVAAGSTLFLINVDMLFVQAYFPKQVSGFYAAAETIAIALVMLCVPVAAVMFPKLVRSRATSAKSDALNLAATGTALISIAIATFCTIWPSFPLRILAPTHMEAAPLLPWFMWAMVPVTLYNVLINSLIAREHYGIIPWAALLPIGYVVVLYYFLGQTHLPPFASFKRVIQILMAFSTTLMLVSVYFSRRASSSEDRVSSSGDGGAGRFQPGAAKPS